MVFYCAVDCMCRRDATKPLSQKDSPKTKDGEKSNAKGKEKSKVVKTASEITSQNPAEDPVKSETQPGRDRSTVHNQTKTIVLTVVPYIEVYAFGLASFALFFLQLLAVAPCRAAFGKVIANSTLMNTFDNTTKTEIEYAKKNYDMLIPFNILTMLFIGFQVSRKGKLDFTLVLIAKIYPKTNACQAVSYDRLM